MRTARVALSLAFAATVAASLGAQPRKGPAAPVKINDIHDLFRGPVTLKFARKNRMTRSAIAAAKQQHVRSIPFWSGSFTSGGAVFPYMMAGGDPRRGGTTVIETSIIPLSFVFDCCLDAEGNPLVVDITPSIPEVLGSPNFQRASYTTGDTQFADAVQRAEFFSVQRRDWHTMLRRPRIMSPVEIEVPADVDDAGNPVMGFPAELPDGTILPVINLGFFVSHLNTLVQLAPIRVDELPMLLVQNALFYDGVDDPFGTCCVLGFHTAFDAGTEHNKTFVQTLVMASIFGHGVGPTIFGPGAFEDITALSHEISEFVDDPFVNNATPPWQFPDGGGLCQADLETGDPVEVLSSITFPVTIGGFTYHPQVEALLQWFSREVPSSAIAGAYSYPDTTTLTSPSKPCSAAKPK
jgi:hypothetical protein